MTQYQKIETIFERDIDGSKKLIEGRFRNPIVQYLAMNDWMWTEKVDGTNIRVHWDGHAVEFGGRTDRAQIPAHLLERLKTLFGGEENAQMFEQMFGDKDVIIFGEGYGEKIQDGGDYMVGCKGVDFIAFDIMVDGYYLSRASVCDIAASFGVQAVPLVGIGTLWGADEYMRMHPKSKLGESKHEMEGLVCRPMSDIYDKFGNRIIVKIKWKDLKGMTRLHDSV